MLRHWLVGFIFLILSLLHSAFSHASVTENFLQALESGNLEEVIRLLGEGANINAKTKDDISPLHLAAYKGRKDVAELLIDKGADVNAKAKNDATPLYVAANQGHHDVVALLIAKGADINARTKDDFSTPLHAAIFLGPLLGHNKYVAKLLIEKGADVTASY